MRRATGLAAERVRRLRIQHGWSARQLAEECARAGLHTLTRSTIAKIESGVRKSITAEEVEVLARVLGTTPTNLLSPSLDNGHVASLTVLHLSDVQFGRDHLFGGHGRVSADRDRDVLFGRLQGDLEQLADDPGLWPDLLVVTGGLTASGGVHEFGQAKEFLTGLAEQLDLERRRIVVVPGDHDVSRSACRAYFLQCEADEVDPQPPYRQKWDHFLRLLRDLHGADGEIVTFDAERQWTLLEVPDLRVVVAGLNSTIADSHRDEDHYGLVGEEQALWFADRLAQYQDKGWLRIGAVHHNPVRAAMLDDQERLRDVDTVDRLLGQRLNLLLHGHGAGIHYLSSGLTALGTGTAAVSHPQSTTVPNRYQLLRITGDGLTRWARSYDQASQRWIADTGMTPAGSWPERISRPWRAAGTTFPAPSRPEPVPTTERTDRGTATQAGSVSLEPDLNDPRSVLLHRMAAICAARHPDAAIRRYPGNPPYLLVTFVDDGFTPQLRLGVCVGDPTREDVDAFLSGAYATDPGITSELVYQGGRSSSDLENYARSRGVRLRSLIEFQGLLDLRGYVAWQAKRLAASPNYSSGRSVPQRYRMIDSEVGDTLQDLPGAVLRWLRS
ncbi:MAG: helix-turn-helix domain-containing protein, partial [Pseudonocardiaceae bacterium]